MSAKFGINTKFFSTGQITENPRGSSIKNDNQLRIVVEDVNPGNTIDIKVKLNGQSAFTTLTTITGNQPQGVLIDIETYDLILIECSNFDSSNFGRLIAASFTRQKSGAFEYTDAGSFPPATGSGNFAWDTTNQIMYYDEPSSQMWVQITGAGAGSGNYFPEIVRSVSAGEISAKQITLAQAPTDIEKTRLFIKGGPIQVYGDDFTVSGTTLSWSGLGLDGLIEESDKIFVTYN
jgi:hypothetical protein